jgi:hypothetical protein
LDVGATTPPTNNGGDGDRARVRRSRYNFENGSGFIELRDVSRDFDVIEPSFAESAPADSIQSHLAQLKRI